MAFESAIRAELADSVIVLAHDGRIEYPAPPMIAAPIKEDNLGDWLEARALEDRPTQLRAAAEIYGQIAVKTKDATEAARALQAQVRCLVQSGDSAAALRILSEQFRGTRLARALDAQGRSVAADEELLAVNLSRGQEAVHRQALEQLHATISDYSLPIPSAQRLFLMEDSQAGPFPTYEAERLAASFLQTDGVGGTEPGLRRSQVSGVWKFTAAGGRMIALYRTDPLLDSLRRVLNAPNSSRDLEFGLVPPGATPQGIEDSAPAGPLLKGWRVTLAIRNRKLFDEMSRRQMASYLWVGLLVVATMVALAVVAGQALRRQMRLARLKTDLVAAVSHEIKTPLASMRLLVDALREDVDLDPRKTREYLELIARENARLSRVIDNFLTFSRMERSRQRFEFTTSEPAALVREAIEAAGDRFQAPDCGLEVDVSPGLPSVRADTDSLVTVLLNLLDNAYKFSGEQKQIRLRVFAESGRVCFAVTDNGIGITPRDQKKIFRRFYQVDRRLSRPAGGCGLGLSIVEFIVGAHDGAISVSSSPGSGSTFTVSLPAAIDAAEQGVPATRGGVAV